MKNKLANIFAIIYFFAVMIWVMLFMIVAIFVFIGDIRVVRESGFAGSNNIALLGMTGLCIGLSLLIPAFRRMYYKLPWMFAFVKIVYIDVLILGVSTMIINYGYEVQDEARHTTFFIIMIAEIIIGRALMCVWFSKKEVEAIID